MGKLEKKDREKQKKVDLQKIVLQSIAAAGIISVALVAPNVIGAMGKLGILPKKRQHEYISSSASKLTEKGLIKFENGYYKLTPKGERVLRHWEILDFEIKKPKKWDKKWRIIIYDISEKKGGVRRKILQLFKQAKFYHLQNSVWVYPYDCEDIIGLLKTNFNVGKETLYIIANEIENDKYLREHFGLLT
jgi:DNA-binding transcriptional regulator PaaX